MSSPSIAVITPIYQTQISPNEQYAIRHILRHLSAYPRYIIAPDTLNINITHFETCYFTAHYFADVAGYNQLMLSEDFYQQFSQFDYILICQLDALILSDQLQAFCEMGYDYIGAPWFASNTNPIEGFIGCGNGGLSLRHVAHSLDVIRSTNFDKLNIFRKLLRVMSQDYADISTNPIYIRWLKKFNLFRHSRHGIQNYIQTYQWNEDRFWGARTPIFYPNFKVAPVEIGLKFAFEMFPAYSFEKNERQLPFGCHAWWRYGEDFWKPHLIEDVPFIFTASKRDTP